MMVIGDTNGFLGTYWLLKVVHGRLVEKADNRNVAALSPGHESKEGNTLEDFIPKSSNDFLTYADLVLDKIRPFEVCVVMGKVTDFAWSYLRLEIMIRVKQLLGYRKPES